MPSRRQPARPHRLPVGAKRATICLMEPRYTSFSQFWPFYLREHRKPETRALHYVGTTLVILLGACAVIAGQWWLLLTLPLAGYFFAWIAHFRIEKNRPATFTYPAWSLIADFRMWYLWLIGRLRPELEKAGVAEKRTARQGAGLRRKK